MHAHEAHVLAALGRQKGPASILCRLVPVDIDAQVTPYLQWQTARFPRESGLCNSGFRPGQGQMGGVFCGHDKGKWVAYFVAMTRANGWRILWPGQGPMGGVFCGQDKSQWVAYFVISREPHHVVDIYGDDVSDVALKWNRLILVGHERIKDDRPSDPNNHANVPRFGRLHKRTAKKHDRICNFPSMMLEASHKRAVTGSHKPKSIFPGT
jgi:hypothetical protein